MYVVVINRWEKDTEVLTQEIVGALGITAYEVQQRLLGGSPTVLSSFADQQQALELVNKLNLLGIATMLVDVTEVRSRTGRITVRHFKLNESSLHIETDDNQHAEIPYEKIDVLLPAISTLTSSETKITTEKKLSLGKTVLTGGIPMYKKVTHKQEVTSEDSQKFLYLYISKRCEPIVFGQNSVTYEGLGDAMKLSREMNFAYLISELHRLSPGAAYDDRLLKRIGQVRLLGPTLNPDSNLDIATEILIRNLR